MKYFLGIVTIFSLNTFGGEVMHECVVNSTVQIYIKEPFKLKEVIISSTEWFKVTKLEHETPYWLEMKNGSDVIGKAEVWTGTLIHASEGSLIQSYAKTQIRGKEAQLSLSMSTAAPFASSIFTLDDETENELILIPIELKCRLVL